MWKADADVESRMRNEGGEGASSGKLRKSRKRERM